MKTEIQSLSSEIFETAPVHILSELDSFERIKKSIEVMWGSVELRTYLTSLLADTRGHTRKGFPKNVASAIMKLSLANIAYLESKGITNSSSTAGFDFVQQADKWNIPGNF
jgi:hypothetical protein